MAEADLTMALNGYASIAELTPEVLQELPYEAIVRMKINADDPRLASGVTVALLDGAVAMSAVVPWESPRAVVCSMV